MSTADEPPLSGYIVVDLSSGIAGAYCTKLLADGGADVVKVEAPEGDPLRRWSASGPRSPPVTTVRCSAFLAVLQAERRRDPDDAADVAMVERLLASADAVVWSRGSRGRRTATLRTAAIHPAAPTSDRHAITPFGLDGPWHDRPATEFTLQAWSGGAIGIGRGSPGPGARCTSAARWGTGCRVPTPRR